MISKLKTVIVSGLIALGAIASFVPVQAQAADNNGWGIVYHPSDCSRPYLRMYGNGDRWSGSTCGMWIDWQLAQAVWVSVRDQGYDHNYTLNEASQLLGRNADSCRRVFNPYKDHGNTADVLIIMACRSFGYSQDSFTYTQAADGY